MQALCWQRNIEVEARSIPNGGSRFRLSMMSAEVEINPQISSENKFADDADLQLNLRFFCIDDEVSRNDMLALLSLS